MPVIKQKIIRREDLINNPDVLYLFGDNAERSGLGGQAREMRGEENAVGIRTKWHPHNGVHAFFSEEDSDEECTMIDDDLEPVVEHLVKGGTVIVPADGIGTGLAALEDHAPTVFAHLTRRLLDLEDL